MSGQDTEGSQDQDNLSVDELTTERDGKGEANEPRY